MGSSRLRNQRGFSVIEAVLAVLLVVAIAAAGYFAYQAHKNKSQGQPVAASKSQTTAAKPTPKPALIDDAAAADFVKQFYVQYADDLIALDGGPDSNKINALLAQDGTQQFVTSSQTPRTYDSVICGHESDISAADITIAAHTAASATEAQVTVGGTGGTSSPHVAVIASGSSFKIDSVTCPGLQ